jgi:peptide deformylase
MAIRKVARLGHPVLRRRAEEIPVAEITGGEVQRLVRDLLETMIEYEGVGLAAPQIFESQRVFVMYATPEGDEDAAPRPTVWINPKLSFVTDTMVDGWEGCLSIPDLRGAVPRHDAARITGYDAQGREKQADYEGFSAIVAQHEFDHLDGIVFLDRMTDLQTLSFVKEHERFWQTEETTEDD